MMYYLYIMHLLSTSLLPNYYLPQQNPILIADVYNATMLKAWINCKYHEKVTTSFIIVSQALNSVVHE